MAHNVDTRQRHYHSEDFGMTHYENERCEICEKSKEEMSQTMYRPSEKTVTLSAPSKDLGPEFRAGEVAHELARCKSILRNARATEFDKQVATQRIEEMKGSI